MSRKEQRLKDQKRKKDDIIGYSVLGLCILLLLAAFLFSVFSIPYGIYVMIVRDIIEGLAYMSFGGFWSIMIFDMVKRWL